MDDDGLGELIGRIPEGWSRIRIDGQDWGITRTTRAAGGVVSFDAERLGAAEALGANVWLTSRGAVLKPCEVPAADVMRVLRTAAAAFEDHDG